MIKRIESWLYRKALDFVCKRDEHHAALRKFLREEPYHDVILGIMQGRRLVFSWELSKEGGLAKRMKDVYNAPNPMFVKIDKEWKDFRKTDRVK